MADGPVVLLTSLNVPGPALAAGLQSEGVELAGIVVQKPDVSPPPGPSLRAAAKYVAKSLIGPELIAEFRLLRLPANERNVLRVERRLRAEAEAELAKYLRDQPSDWPSGVPLLETPDPDSEASVRFLKSIAPRVTVVWGTGILKDVLDVPGQLAVNAHTSILPDYRGTFVEFWQCYNRDLDRAGVTFHVVDRGVDTGDVLFQERVTASPEDHPFAIRTRNTILILRRYPDVVRRVLSGECVPRPQGHSEMGTFRARDITLEKRQELYRRLGCLAGE